VPKTRKMSFRSQEAAERQAAEWAQHNSSRYRAYLCDGREGCGWWHLTHPPRREFEA